MAEKYQGAAASTSPRAPIASLAVPTARTKPRAASVELVDRTVRRPDQKSAALARGGGGLRVRSHVRRNRRCRWREDRTARRRHLRRERSARHAPSCSRQRSRRAGALRSSSFGSGCGQPRRPVESHMCVWRSQSDPPRTGTSARTHRRVQGSLRNRAISRQTSSMSSRRCRPNRRRAPRACACRG